MKKLFYILCCSLAVLFTACEKGELSEKSNGDGSTSGSGVSKVHEYVDLGLSVKWATCNVGATKPEDYGDYFAWGETQPKSEYNWKNYKWCEGSDDTLTKYCTDSDDGIVDNKTVLDLTDDAANVNWGGDWRMPTWTEWYELLEECTWIWSSLNGVIGYNVTSKINNNSIFLPAAGYRVNTDLDGVGSFGNYWSQSRNWLNSGSADDWSFHMFCIGCTSIGERYSGLPVRPVMP